MMSKPPIHSATAPPEQERGAVGVAAHRQPRAERREPGRQAEHQVAEPGEALGVGVEHERRHRDRPQPRARSGRAARPRPGTRQRGDAEARAPAPRESSPDGTRAPAVRGLRASISASISRFSAIARLRAPTIASVTQPSVAADGISPTDRIAPTKANGSANTVCSNLTSETNRRA